MRPIILLSCTEITRGSADPSVQRPHGLCDADTSEYRRDGLLMSYVRCVTRAGGSAVLLPNTADAESVAAAVSRSHGLLLTGGGDVAAGLYGPGQHPTMSRPDADRDETERLAIQEAMRLHLPILGICRGIQILNVVLGGTLIQDIPSWRNPAAGPDSGPAVVHGNNATHGVRIEPGSVFDSLWGRTDSQVDSSHHQAVEDVAPALKVTASAPDGIVEAAESNDGHPILALQCHPERLAHREPRFAVVFSWLVDEAGSQ